MKDQDPIYSRPRMFPDMDRIPRGENLKRLFDSADNVRMQWKEFEREIQARSDNLSSQPWRENAPRMEEFAKRYHDLFHEARQVAHDEIHAFAKAVWEGEAGEGTLVVLDQDRWSIPQGEFLPSRNPYSCYRLARIADFSPFQMFSHELAKGVVPMRYKMIKLPPKKRGGADFLSYHQFPERWSFATSLGQANLLAKWEPELVEVCLGQPSQEELRELYPKVRTWNRSWKDNWLGSLVQSLSPFGNKNSSPPLHPADIIDLFGPIAQFEPGETFLVKSSEDDLEGSYLETNVHLVYLPTGRWAVVVRRRGDWGNSVDCVDIITNPAADLQIDKFPPIEGESYAYNDLTTQEQAFLNDLLKREEETNEENLESDE